MGSLEKVAEWSTGAVYSLVIPGGRLLRIVDKGGLGPSDEARDPTWVFVPASAAAVTPELDELVGKWVVLDPVDEGEEYCTAKVLALWLDAQGLVAQLVEKDGTLHSRPIKNLVRLQQEK
jgi:hypothetical protein